MASRMYIFLALASTALFGFSTALEAGEEALDKNTVIFTDDSADLTKGVLEQLNANDPSKASAPSPSKAPKK